MKKTKTQELILDLIGEMIHVILPDANLQGMLSKDEWNEAIRIIEQTGKIPDKYAGRITEVTTSEGYRITKGNPAAGEPYGETEKVYYDTAVLDALRAHAAEIDRLCAEVLKAEKEDNPAPEVLDITNLPNLIPTSETLQYALSGKLNDHAYIMPFDLESLQLKPDENGQFFLDTTAQYDAIEDAKGKLKEHDKKKLSVAGIDQPLLRQLFSASMKAYLCNYGNSITVYLPSFAHEMGIDIHGANRKAEADQNGTQPPRHNANDFFRKLKALEGLSGVWENGSFYRVFFLESYDADQNTLTFSSPWLYKIIKELLENKKKKTRKDGSVMWEITGIATLMKSSIVSARSKPTVEIIATLIAGLTRCGTTPEAKRHPGKRYRDKEMVEYTITWKTLIDRIPLIAETLNGCTPANQTTLLQRFVCGSNWKQRIKDKRGTILEEYIRKYTFLHDYYKGFEISFDKPTAKTLSNKITIRHRGINGDFKPDNGLNAYLFSEKKDGENPVGEV